MVKSNNELDITQTRTYNSAALGHPNPLPQLFREAQEHFTGERFVSVIVSFGSGHPGIIPLDPAYHAAPGLFGRGEAVRSQTREKMLADCELVAEEMARRMGDTGVLCRLSVEQGMQGMPELIVNDSQLDKMTTMVDTYLEQAEVRNSLQKLAASLVRPERLVALESISEIIHPIKRL